LAYKIGPAIHGEMKGVSLNLLRRIFNIGYGSIVLLFMSAGFCLAYFAAVELWTGINPAHDVPVINRLNAILESVGLMTIAVVAFELGQTILEEELLRQAHISTPTRVRRFLSRFMVVVVVALSIESLVAIFELVHKDASQLPQAASVAFAAAVLLAAWGCFIRLNRSAEELEPEAMEKAKREDETVE
jgi:hypothetical protein